MNQGLGRLKSIFLFEIPAWNRDERFKIMFKGDLVPIDIEKLSFNELIELNRRVIRRLDYFLGLKTQAHLNRFEVGDRVSFLNDGRAVEGIVTRVNHKTLSVKTKDTRWTIPPQFLTKISGAGQQRALTVEDILGQGPSSLPK